MSSQIIPLSFDLSTGPQVVLQNADHECILTARVPVLSGGQLWMSVGTPLKGGSSGARPLFPNEQLEEHINVGDTIAFAWDQTTGTPPVWAVKITAVPCAQCQSASAVGAPTQHIVYSPPVRGALLPQVIEDVFRPALDIYGMLA